MTQIKLLEFKNQSGNILRGILTYSSRFSTEAILMAGGFERSVTTEKKFKVLANKLINKGIPSLRFDYTGLGLSDGDFSKTTIKTMGKDFERAYQSLKQKVKCENISVVVHSLSACIVAKAIERLALEKIILMAPALNQRDLLRYWFVVFSLEKDNPNLKVTWRNFKGYLNEELFLKDCKKNDKMTKMNYINAGYFLENEGKDYSKLLTDKQNVLYVHGDSDVKVPKESLNVDFNNKIIVKGGDHDLERPDMAGQWLDKTIDFITN